MYGLAAAILGAFLLGMLFITLYRCANCWKIDAIDIFLCFLGVVGFWFIGASLGCWPK